MKLVVTHSPHIKTPDTTKRIMTDVLIALIPASISAVVNFGWRAFLLMAVSILAAMLTESILKNYKHGIIARLLKTLFLRLWTILITRIIICWKRVMTLKIL